MELANPGAKRCKTAQKLVAAKAGVKARADAEADGRVKCSSQKS